jgi:methylenetetrahydrofolate reductase (NADPH)
LEQCHDLLDNNVAGIHFYTLNRSDATRVIFDSLGIPRRQGAQAPTVQPSDEVRKRLAS